MVTLDYIQLIARQTRYAILGQSRHQAILRKHIEALGGTVELGTELITLSQDEDAVTVTLSKTTGDINVEEIAKFAYVIGTDGGRSMLSTYTFTSMPVYATYHNETQVPFVGPWRSNSLAKQRISQYYLLM